MVINIESLKEIICLTGCPKHNEVNWTISWPTTNVGETATQKCPGGIESMGIEPYYIHTYSYRCIIKQ